MTKSKAAFLFASQTLGKQRLYLWTFTFKEVLAVKETRKRWNSLADSPAAGLAAAARSASFRTHEEHGLHVHLVTNQFIDVNRARELATQPAGAAFMSRQCRANMPDTSRSIFRRNGRNVCFDGDLWAGFGKGWEWTKVKDVIRETLFSRIYRACKEWKGWTGRDHSSSE